MITVSGSIGDGGGHILRGALALSAASERPFRITEVRAGREMPGLLRQHAAAIRAVAAICAARVDGATLGSSTFTFHPGPVRAGAYHCSLGSAGNAALLLQAILPALLVAGDRSTVTIEGVTYSTGAPPFEFIQKALVPLLNRMGPSVVVSLDRAGFYPAGGGRLTVEVTPAPSFSPLHLPEHGGSRHRRCRALIAALPGEIAVRELDLVKRMLDWPEECFEIRQLPEDEGPGNVVMIDIGDDEVTEVFTALGVRGVRAEAVAESVLRQAKTYLAAGAPVGPHLAEQLLVPMAVTGGGSFLTTALSRCATGTVELIRAFLDVDVSVESAGRNRWLVTVPSHKSGVEPPPPA